MARLCMSYHDKDLYTILLPLIEKSKTSSPFNRGSIFPSFLSIGMYIRFLSTLEHLEEALTDYAELTPDYLKKNPSITSELFTGMYNGGYYNELIRLMEFIKMDDSLESLDSVNYSRIITDYIKSKAKLGMFGDIQPLLDECFSKHVLFLPMSYAEIISVCVYISLFSRILRRLMRTRMIMII